MRKKEPSVRPLVSSTDSAGDNKRAKSRFFLGVQALARGDRAAAKANWEWVRDHGTKAFTEYDLALRELAALEANKDASPSQ